MTKTNSRLWSFIFSMYMKNPIINWTVLEKCKLIILLSSGMILSWIIWKLFVLLHPELWKYVNIRLIKIDMWVCSLTLTLLIFLMYLCHYHAHRIWIQKVIPIVTIYLFALILYHGSYMTGSLSPATAVGYISTVVIGLILFDRWLIYITLIPATLLLLITGCLSLKQYIPYAPVFNIAALKPSPAQHNFWVGSMVFFSVPILIGFFGLFEILLSQWREREYEIKRLSQLDFLTNLLNRRSINEALNTLQHDHTPQSYAIILLDVDHFKHINDQYGHHTGDQVLIAIAECLRRHSRQQDKIGRFGGEEFIVLLPQTSLRAARQVAERYRLALETLIISPSKHLHIQVSASFGVASCNEAEDSSQILTQADQALYLAKACGRNQVKSYTGDIQQFAHH